MIPLSQNVMGELRGFGNDPWQNFRLVYNWGYQRALFSLQLSAAFLFMLIGTSLGSTLAQTFLSNSLSQYMSELALLLSAVALATVTFWVKWIRYSRVLHWYIIQGKRFPNSKSKEN